MNIANETIPLSEAAARMGRSPAELANRLRKCALTGVTFPLGFALPPGSDRGQWIYVIPRKRFEAYMNGLDLSVPEERLKTLFQQ